MSWPLPSISMILSGIFVAWILNSMYTIYGIFNPAPCDGGMTCLNPSFQLTDTFKVYLAHSTSSHPLSSTPTVVWKDSKFKLDTDRQVKLEVDLPASVIKNGSLWLHVILTSSKSSQMSAILRDRKTTYISGRLTKYAQIQAKSYSLLSDDNVSNNGSSFKSKTSSTRPVTHWKPFIVVDIAKPVSMKLNEIPGEISSYIRLNHQQNYLPILFISEIRTRVRDLWPVNTTYPSLPITIKFEPSPIGKIRFMLIAEASLQTMHALGFSELDTDDVKAIFFDTNIFLLLLTVFVTSCHMLFDFLAFKSDIQFWRKRESMAGLSFATLRWRCLSQLIITVYLFDQGTSLLVLGPSAIATVIELWKLKKGMKVRWNGLNGIWYESRSREEMATDEYDSEFMKYLSRFVLYPLVVGGAIYSLMYTQHKSWTSWVIQSMANGVYAFGFLFMLPQLFINYKLKSVAHLPWRVFMYKAFNTFIDDLFAFILTSIPTAHRVAAFRDDFVFLIYLYQRWLYPVDRKRATEFSEAEKYDEKKSK